MTARAPHRGRLVVFEAAVTRRAGRTIIARLPFVREVAGRAGIMPLDAMQT
jgi:hypothetical protein